MKLPVSFSLCQVPSWTRTFPPLLMLLWTGTWGRGCWEVQRSRSVSSICRRLLSGDSVRCSIRCNYGGVVVTDVILKWYGAGAYICISKSNIHEVSTWTLIKWEQLPYFLLLRSSNNSEAGRDNITRRSSHRQLNCHRLRVLVWDGVCVCTFLAHMAVYVSDRRFIGSTMLSGRIRCS